MKPWRAGEWAWDKKQKVATPDFNSWLWTVTTRRVRGWGASWERMFGVQNVITAVKSLSEFILSNKKFFATFPDTLGNIVIEMHGRGGIGREGTDKPGELTRDPVPPPTTGCCPHSASMWQAQLGICYLPGDPWSSDIHSFEGSSRACWAALGLCIQGKPFH